MLKLLKLSLWTSGLKKISKRLLLCQEKLSSIAILRTKSKLSEDFENVAEFVPLKPGK